MNARNDYYTVTGSNTSIQMIPFSLIPPLCIVRSTNNNSHVLNDHTVLYSNFIWSFRSLDFNDG